MVLRTAFLNSNPVGCSPQSQELSKPGVCLWPLVHQSTLKASVYCSPAGCFRELGALKEDRLCHDDRSHFSCFLESAARCWGGVRNLNLFARSLAEAAAPKGGRRAGTMAVWRRLEYGG